MRCSNDKVAVFILGGMMKQSFHFISGSFHFRGNDEAEFSF